MSYQALYRKWRPLSFDDVVGQGHIVSTLKNEIQTGRAAHAYLFCGTRGTGKTSCAKIFARAVNCLNPQNGNPCNECEICRGALDGSILDIVEIDAASNNGVDNIREIREEVSYSAAQAKYKIYIIDEVHMLSGGAFNALLKTLEEPPAYVVFILATTEAHKLPATITSRCQRFDFKRISVRDIVTRLREIVTAENIDIDIEALELIARLSDGAMRDALSILDQCVGACEGKITIGAAQSILSIASDEIVDDTVSAIASKDNLKIIRCVAQVVEGGKDINNYIDLLIRRFRDILVCKVSETIDGLFEYSLDTVEKIQKSASIFDEAELSYIIETLCAASADAKWQKSARTLYELALIRLCDDRLSLSKSAILSRIEKLEAMMDCTEPISQRKSAAHADRSEKQKEKNDDMYTEQDMPPWEADEIIEPPAKKAESETKAPIEEKTEKTEKEEFSENIKKNAVRKVAKKTPSNVWGELLGVLKKKYPPLYGALSVKKAKFKENTLYIINESYVKQIITMLKSDFDAALASVVGSDVRVQFVTDAEFDMIEESGAIDIKSDIQVITNDFEVHEEKEPDEKMSSNKLEEDEDDDDPLNALLSIDNDDIVIEE